MGDRSEENYIGNIGVSDFQDFVHDVLVFVLRVVGPGRCPKGLINIFRSILTESEPVATLGDPIRANFRAGKNPPNINLKKSRNILIFGGFF